MLPMFSLDDEDFDTILNKAVGSIAKYQQEWTNYNPSDGGIVLLELLAWMQEMQRFYLDQNGMENEALYLELLGLEPQKRTPSELLVHLSGNEPTQIYADTGFYTENFRFEPEMPLTLEGEKIQVCYTQKQDGSLLQQSSPEYLHFGVWMFGEEPAAGDCFYLGLDRPIQKNRIHSLYWKLEEPKGQKRNPLPKESEPLFSRYLLEYWNGAEWKECIVQKDETAGFLQSGFMYWMADGDMEIVEEMYWLRVRLTSCEYDLPPRILDINSQYLKLLQKETIAASVTLTLPVEEAGVYQINLREYFDAIGEAELFIKKEEYYEKQESRFYENSILEFQYEQINRTPIEVLITVRHTGDQLVSWEATGFPDQVIDLRDSKVMGKSLQVLVEQEDHPGTYRLWKPVSHFWKADSMEECYCFQEKEGLLLFGDGEHGKIPEGRILLIDCVATYGAEGRIKEREKLYWRNGQAINPAAAVGGTQPESRKECLETFVEHKKEMHRAVTNEDYEILVKQTPGLFIKRVRAISDEQDENCITLITEAGVGNPRYLNPTYRQHIFQWLEQKRMLGTRIKLKPPIYIPIQVMLEIEIQKGFSQAEDWIRRVVEDYFLVHMDSFGATFNYSHMYGTIDGLECVAAIKNLTVTAQGKGIHYQNNRNFLLPMDSLAALEEVNIQWVRGNIR